MDNNTTIRMSGYANCARERDETGEETILISEVKKSSYHPPGSETAASCASLTLGSSRPLSDIAAFLLWRPSGSGRRYFGVDQWVGRTEDSKL